MERVRHSIAGDFLGNGAGWAAGSIDHARPTQPHAAGVSTDRAAAATAAAAVSRTCARLRSVQDYESRRHSARQAHGETEVVRRQAPSESSAEFGGSLRRRADCAMKGSTPYLLATSLDSPSSATAILKSCTENYLVPMAAAEEAPAGCDIAELAEHLVEAAPALGSDGAALAEADVLDFVAKTWRCSRCSAVRVVDCWLALGLLQRTMRPSQLQLRPSCPAVFFACELCPARYAVRASLRAHRASAHAGAPCASDPLIALPDEVLVRVLSRLTPCELAAAARVSHAWRRWLWAPGDPAERVWRAALGGTPSLSERGCCSLPPAERLRCAALARASLLSVLETADAQADSLGLPGAGANAASLPSMGVCAVALGGLRHVLVACINGALLVAGRACCHGELGLGAGVCETALGVLAPVRLGREGDESAERVLGVAAGAHVSFAWTAHAVYSWGSAAAGLLGHGASEADEWQPRAIACEALRGVRIVQVAVSPSHVLMLAEDGAVLGLGSSERGQLGLGETIGGHAAQPVRLACLAGVLVTQLAVGSAHSIACTLAGDVLVWGDNSVGQLGLGFDCDACALPAIVPYLALRRVVAVEVVAAGSYALVRTASGAVYGLGDVPGFGPSDAPVRLRGLHEVSALAAAPTHALLYRDSREDAFTLGAMDFGEALGTLAFEEDFLGATARDEASRPTPQRLGTDRLRPVAWLTNWLADQQRARQALLTQPVLLDEVSQASEAAPDATDCACGRACARLSLAPPLSRLDREVRRVRSIFAGPGRIAFLIGLEPSPPPACLCNRAAAVRGSRPAALAAPAPASACAPAQSAKGGKQCLIA